MRKKVIILLVCIVAMVFLLHCIGCSNQYDAPMTGDDQTWQGMPPGGPPDWLKETPPPFP